MRIRPEHHARLRAARVRLLAAFGEAERQPTWQADLAARKAANDRFLDEVEEITGTRFDIHGRPVATGGV